MNFSKKPLLLLLALGFAFTAFAQPTTSKEVQLCANLSALLELQCNPNNSSLITFNIDTKDKWENGAESADFSDFSVCATTDWKLTCEVVGANGDDIDELNGNGGKLPLACIGHKIMWNGTNNVTNYVANTSPLSAGVNTVIEPAPGQSNIGGAAENNFIIWWGVGQHALPLMPDESLLEKQVKAGTYKVKVVYTLLPVI